VARGGPPALIPQRRAPVPLLGLPDTLWLHVFCFVGSAKCFRALEQTCKGFRHILQHDSVWKACFGEEVRWRDNHYQDTYETIYRDEAFTGIACRSIQHWQSTTENLILDVYGNVWKNDIENLLNNSRRIYENLDDLNRGDGDNNNNIQHRFILRGDAAYVLASIVESCLTEMLKRALIYAIHSRREGHISVQTMDIQAARQYFGVYAHTEGDQRYDELYNKILGNAFVRRIAYRAGIAKMDNLVYEEVLSNMRGLSLQLALPACIELAAQPKPRRQIFTSVLLDIPTQAMSAASVAGSSHVGGSSMSGHPKMVLDGQKMTDVSPYPISTEGESGQRVVLEHIIVPRQIESAASRFGLPCTKVYGTHWYATSEGGEEIERARARAMYIGTDGESIGNTDDVSWHDGDSENDSEKGDGRPDFNGDELSDDEMLEEDYDWESEDVVARRNFTDGHAPWPNPHAPNVWYLDDPRGTSSRPQIPEQNDGDS